MNDIDEILSNIIDKVIASKLSEKEKADIFAQLTVGMHRLVWPILLEHVPESLLKKAVAHDQLSLDEYTELIQTALRGPNTAGAVYDELKSALEEVDSLVDKTLH